MTEVNAIIYQAIDALTVKSADDAGMVLCRFQSSISIRPGMV
jgi:hypothetical protein